MRHLLGERRPFFVTVGNPSAPAYVRGPAFQGFAILRAAYSALPIIAGADKFLHVLANWSLYLAPVLAARLGGHANGFMHVVGLVEISAGVLVAIKPRIGAPLVGLWLLAIVANLLLARGYYDVAMRDLGLAAGALALSRLSAQLDR